AVQVLHVDGSAHDVAINANGAEPVVDVHVIDAHKGTAALDPTGPVPAVVENPVPAPVPIAIEPRTDDECGPEDERRVAEENHLGLIDGQKDELRANGVDLDEAA